MGKPVRKIAIILEDTLHRLGLQGLLTDYFSPVAIDPFTGFPDFERFGSSLHGEPYDYYFLSPECYGLHLDRFLPFRSQVLLVSRYPHPEEPNHLDASLPHEELAERISAFFAEKEKNQSVAEPNRELTQREIEVLKMIVRGKINKEIAEELSIGFQTVLSHRKNLTAKLGIKTVSGLTFYALTYGHIGPEEIGK